MAKPAVTDLDRQIGLRLKKLRQQADISAVALADAIGSTQQQISRYENGQNKLSAAQLYLLAQSLCVPISWFFLDCDPDPVPRLVKQMPAHYLRNTLDEEINSLRNLWPKLTQNQRTAMLKLLDSFMDRKDT
ncbi:helix-turn-helix domain-containing protein [Cellvibrio japonicus]|uniref:MrfJ protein n=1 Tax=Cellvibrio japonicus (strain Ueda107) TaxID=498211 RepID=B3PHX7_CELJU|nr:helix-turn-helix transcriptional regulator [Cellvibrio japonicus]ACE85814.1 MrfJ protein [Cellvibrio japonicus Ueda107]QEI13912.1 helix-turn-helix transcriptional regulator [Cellvibrio japonicus]QEI17486.1 helix-turn-helix transcriptional regulator [Cellvibrio japonicus]QEI21062.1 helix-turn-helix transcriptional regulator [Cellvibrio japonicus]